MNGILGRLGGVSEKIQAGCLNRQTYITAMKREVADLRRALIAENLAIRAVWFGSTTAVQPKNIAPETAVVHEKKTEETAETACITTNTAEADRAEALAQMVAEKAGHQAEAARTKKAAAEEARAKLSAEKASRMKQAMEAAKMKKAAEAVRAKQKTEAIQENAPDTQKPQ